MKFLKDAADNWKAIVTLVMIVPFIGSSYLELQRIRDATASLPAFQISMEERMARYEETLEQVWAEVDAIRMDQPVVEISRFSGIDQDQCGGVGEPCLVNLIMRRRAGFEDCEIQYADHYVASAVDLQPRPVKVLDIGAGIRNLTLEWSPVEIWIELPERIPSGEADYFFIAYYLYCDGEDDDQEKIHTSRPIPFQVAST